MYCFQPIYAVFPAAFRADEDAHNGAVCKRVAGAVGLITDDVANLHIIVDFGDLHRLETEGF